MKPFLEKKGVDAQIAIKENKGKHAGFSISDVKYINNTVKIFFLKDIAKAYKKDTGKEFSDLHTDVQTAVFSAIYNYGPSSHKEKNALHTFWLKISEGKYKEAADELEQKPYNPKRRKKEADLIRKTLKP